MTSSTWMVYGPYDTPIGFAEKKVTEYLDSSVCKSQMMQCAQPTSAAARLKAGEKVW